MNQTKNFGLWVQACAACRLCMDNPGTVNMFSPIDWSQDILTHTGIKVSQTHQNFHGEKLHMPLSMCELCHDMIQHAKILKEGAHKADAKWRLKRHELELPPDKSDQDDFHTVKTEVADSTVVKETCQRCSDRAKKHKKGKRRKSSELRDRQNHLHATISKTISVRKDLYECSATLPNGKSKATNSVHVTSPPKNKNTSSRISTESSELMTPQVLLQILLGEEQTGNVPTTSDDLQISANPQSELSTDELRKPANPQTKLSTNQMTSIPTSKSERQSNENKSCSRISEKNSYISKKSGNKSCLRKSENKSPPSPLKIAVKYQVVNGREEFKCDTCHKIFATKKKLYIHNLSHNKKYLCPLDVCGKRFAIRGDLEKHIRSHTGERPYKCRLCDQSFSQKGSLKTHDENVHREKHNCEN